MDSNPPRAGGGFVRDLRELVAAFAPGVLSRGKNQGSIYRLAEQIEELIKTAIARRESGDCIVILHDADEFSREDDSPYRKIADVCKKYKDDVLLLIAHDEIEAWLLADGGLSKWLKMKPKNWDNERKPSDSLKSFVKDIRGIKYQGDGRAKVLSHVDGTGHLPRRSPSMKEAIENLEKQNCLCS